MSFISTLQGIVLVEPESLKYSFSLTKNCKLVCMMHPSVTIGRFRSSCKCNELVSEHERVRLNRSQKLVH